MRRQFLLLSGAGALCLLLSVLGGALSKGSLEPAMFLLRAGVIYLTLGVVTYLLAPITPRSAILGALCASGLAFLAGLIAMYYHFIVAPSPYTPPLTMSRLVSTQAVAFFLTLPISAGYLSGVLIRADRQGMANATLVGAMLIGLVGGSWIWIPEAAAPTFLQIMLFVGVVATAVLGLLPTAVMAGVKLIPESTLGGNE